MQCLFLRYIAVRKLKVRQLDMAASAAAWHQQQQMVVAAAAAAARQPGNDPRQQSQRDNRVQLEEQDLVVAFVSFFARGTFKVQSIGKVWVRALQCPEGD